MEKNGANMTEITSYITVYRILSNTVLHLSVKNLFVKLMIILSVCNTPLFDPEIIKALHQGGKMDL